MKNKKTTILLAAVLVMNAAAMAGWFYLYSLVAERRDGVNEARREMALVEKRADESRSLKKLMDGIKQEREKINAVFLDEDSVINFIELLEKTSGKAGVSLSLNSISVGGKGPSFRFGLSGTFGEVYRYLGLVENMPQQIIFQKVDLRAKKNASGAPSGKWSAEVDIILTGFDGV